MAEFLQVKPVSITNCPPDYQTEAVRQLYLINGSGLAVVPFLGAAFVWGLWGHVNTIALLAWYGAWLITAPLWPWLLIRRYHAANPAPEHAALWGSRMTWLNAAEGTLWGIAGIFFFVPNSLPQQLLLLVFLIGKPAGSIFSTSWWPPAFYANATTSLLLTSGGMFLRGSSEQIAIGVGLLVYLAGLLQVMRMAHASTLETIALRFEKHELIEQLRHEKALAERANLAKSKFLAAASHDLRQPIHAQGLFLEVLSHTEQTSYQQELLANARAASEASSELLNALLDFSRIEAGVIKPQFQPFRLQPLFNKIEIEFVPQADAKDLVYRSRETRLVVNTDPMLLELILRNLVSNAIRYTDHGGVLVACRQHGNQAVLEVWDTGIGIAPEHQKEVFQEFHQLGNPERNRNKGLGLGLAIANGLSRALGHELSLVSTQQRGSVFRLTLPIDTSAPAVPAAMLQSKTRLLNARLLVIDDDEIVREGMLHLLRDWGCECDAAESIEEALALAELNAPDVVISDYRLREQRTGVEAIAALRALLGETLPALLITGDTAPERLREALESGIPLLHKPVAPGKLYRKLVELQQS
jgi:signal transduction histidine kinase/CheY-like chemotaxis protein